MVSKSDVRRKCCSLDIRFLDFGHYLQHSLTFNFGFLCGFRRDEDLMTQWQCEFRGQIRALTQWLKNMEMRLPPLEPRVSLVFCLDSILPFEFFFFYIFITFSTLLPSFLLYILFKSCVIAASLRFSLMGHPVVTHHSTSYQ